MLPHNGFLTSQGSFSVLGASWPFWTVSGLACGGCRKCSQMAFFSSQSSFPLPVASWPFWTVSGLARGSHDRAIMAAIYVGAKANRAFYYSGAIVALVHAIAIMVAV